MKKNLLTVLILALVIVNIVLSAITMFSVTSTNSKTAQLVSNIGTVLDLELAPPGQEAEPQVSLADTEVFDLGSLTMPLQMDPNGEQKYLQCSLSLSVNKKHDDYKAYGSAEKMTANASLIKDAVSTVVGNYTVEQCTNDRDSLKADILKAVQDLYGSDFVYQVAISDVKIG